MSFNVPQGGSSIVHIEITPVLPVNGVAQKWQMVNTSANPNENVDRLDVEFARSSTPEQRQSERMIFVLSIAESAQLDNASWRFTESGIMYCAGEADYLQDMELELSNDGKVLTASVKCLTDIEETVNFSFLAIRRDVVSGECGIYASADPGSTWGRR